MNCQTCQLKELVVVPTEIQDVLRCILHTIIFHRALGLVRPQDVECEHFEITYVHCGDHEIEKKIDEKIDQFVGWVEKHPNRKGQVCLSFYEVKNKHATWFGNKIERLYWEQWYINLHVLNPKSHGKSHYTKAPVSTGENASEESSSRHAALESSLHEVLFQIIRFANEKKTTFQLYKTLRLYHFHMRSQLQVHQTPLLVGMLMCLRGCCRLDILPCSVDYKIMQAINYFSEPGLYSVVNEAEEKGHFVH
ncbi:hypothetical protein C4D60_Mb08t28470 [Musa balbisiana]|uniref:Autophagy-related protein 101 n=1 Tax=Musa balbisiana TaxID=52838 RepID=A0A4S8K777_MUSBA|nr:hypothetical protein C4D60_Mb08t28470 [Musa balbisiana]